MCAVALSRDLQIRPAAAAVHAPAVRVLVCALGYVLSCLTYLADTVSVGLRAHVADTLNLPCAAVRRLARRTRFARQRARVVCHRILRACAASSQYCSCRDDVGFPLVC